jgi:hypothetical protein
LVLVAALALGVLVATLFMSPSDEVAFGQSDEITLVPAVSLTPLAPMPAQVTSYSYKVPVADTASVRVSQVADEIVAEDEQAAAEEDVEAVDGGEAEVAWDRDSLRDFNSKVRPPMVPRAKALADLLTGPDLTEQILDVPPADNVKEFGGSIQIVYDEFERYEDADRRITTARRPTSTIESSSSMPHDAAAGLAPVYVVADQQANPAAMNLSVHLASPMQGVGTSQLSASAAPMLSMSRAGATMTSALVNVSDKNMAMPMKTTASPGFGHPALTLGSAQVDVVPSRIITLPEVAPRSHVDLPAVAQVKKTVPATTAPGLLVAQQKKQSQPSFSPGFVNEPIVVLIDKAQSLGSQKLARINDAVASINQAARNAGVNMQLATATDPGAKASMRLESAAGRSLGLNTLGYAQASEHGFGGVVSIADDFNWFTGEDVGQMASDQFDYQTAVEHEFLHLLGLDDDFGSGLADRADNFVESSVMSDILLPGQSNRELHASDIGSLARAFANGRSGRSHSGALTTIPEPVSLGLLLGGGMFLLGWRRRG